MKRRFIREFIVEVDVEIVNPPKVAKFQKSLLY